MAKQSAHRKIRQADSARAAVGRKGGIRKTGQRLRQTRAAERQATKPADALRGRDGCVVAVSIFERRNGASHKTIATVTIDGRGFSRAQGRGHGLAYGRSASSRSAVLAALGHPERFRILGKLLEGPATYRAIRRVTRMKAGPLYHHVNQLRLARLILPKQRDLYELTRGGRNAVILAHLIFRLSRDARSRTGF